jgi:hypothetical protein
MPVAATRSLHAETRPHGVDGESTVGSRRMCALAPLAWLYAVAYSIKQYVVPYNDEEYAVPYSIDMYAEPYRR